MAEAATEAKKDKDLIEALKKRKPAVEERLAEIDRDWETSR